MTSVVASARLLWTSDGLGVGLSFHSSVLQQSKKKPHLRYFWMQITKPNSSSFVRKAVRPPRRNGTGGWKHFRNPEEVSSLFLFSASLFLPDSFSPHPLWSAFSIHSLQPASPTSSTPSSSIRVRFSPVPQFQPHTEINWLLLIGCALYLVNAGEKGVDELYVL